MKIRYITMALMAGVFLTGCYDSNLEGVDYVPDMKTLPPVVDGDSHKTILRGWSNQAYKDYFYFEISRSKDFNSEETTTVISNRNAISGDSIANYFYTFNSLDVPGTYYYRFMASKGDEKVYAAEVETFTVENSLEIQPAANITSKGANLTCFTYGGYFNDKQFIVSTSRDFEDYDKVPVNSSSSLTDGHYTFTGNIDYLKPETRYYAKFVMRNYNPDITLESDVIEFTTEKIDMIEVKINALEGTFFENGQTPNFKILIRNSSDEKVWYGPFVAKCSEENKTYSFVDKVEIPLIENSGYLVYAVNDKETTWDSSGYVVLSNNAYNEGDMQNPIYYGMNDFSYTNPLINLFCNEVTSQLSIDYPQEWGKVVQVKLESIYDKEFFMGNTFSIESMKCLGYSNTYFGRSSEGCVTNGSKYRYSFNIFPVDIPEGYVNIVFEFSDSKPMTLPFPALKLKSGEKKTIEFNGLGVEDVIVKDWTPIEGGSIIIVPKN